MKYNPPPPIYYNCIKLSNKKKINYLNDIFMEVLKYKVVVWTES